MVRIVGFFAGLLFVAVLMFAAFQRREPSDPLPHGLPPLEQKWSFDSGFGIFGKYDNRQLQRGFAVYKGVCSSCHSLKLVAFRDLEDIGFKPAEVKAIAKDWASEVPSINPETGEPATRKALPSDYFPGPYANEVAGRAANNNALPPDMSLLAKAREGGSAYIYSLVSHGYDDKARPKGFETPDGLYFNKYYANLNIAMPPPLSADGQVDYADGTKSTIDQNAKDVAAFLMWTAEPKLRDRRETGLASVLFLIVLSGLLWGTYKKVWRDVKTPPVVRGVVPAE